MIRISKGNMYKFITHTWNAIKGECFHDCVYCYMKQYGKLKPIRLEMNEFKEFKRDIEKFGEGLNIFVGSSIDMFNKKIPNEWIDIILSFLRRYDNYYFFQSKNPARFKNFKFPEKTKICTTIESDIFYKETMQNSPKPYERVIGIMNLPYEKYITIEPIMDFNLFQMVRYIKMIRPTQVNIGADSQKKDLIEPKSMKVKELIKELSEFTNIHIKSNLNRIIKN